VFRFICPQQADWCFSFARRKECELVNYRVAIQLVVRLTRSVCNGKFRVDIEFVAITTVFVYPSSTMEEIVSVSFQRTGNSRGNIFRVATKTTIVLSKEGIHLLINIPLFALFTKSINIFDLRKNI